MSETFEFVSAFRNSKTGKWFILLDESADRYRLINPEGITVNLNHELFDEEPQVFDVEKSPAELSDLQVVAYRAFLVDQQKRAEQEAKMEKHAKERPQRTVVVDRPVRSEPRRKSESLLNQKTGVGASWSGSTLVFYRPQIDRLGNKQSFRVIVDGVGEFVIPKLEFQKVFSDVVLSPKFKQEGFFAYDAVPDKAKRFLQA